jgi:hypothetical protein
LSAAPPSSPPHRSPQPPRATSPRRAPLSPLAQQLEHDPRNFRPMGPSIAGPCQTRIQALNVIWPSIAADPATVAPPSQYKRGPHPSSDHTSTDLSPSVSQALAPSLSSSSTTELCLAAGPTSIRPPSASPSSPLSLPDNRRRHPVSYNVATHLLRQARYLRPPSTCPIQSPPFDQNPSA